jgi:hypothetical protein
MGAVQSLVCLFPFYPVVRFAEPNDRFIIARLGWLRNRGKFRVFFSPGHTTQAIQERLI